MSLSNPVSRRVPLLMLRVSRELTFPPPRHRQNASSESTLAAWTSPHRSLVGRCTSCTCESLHLRRTSSKQLDLIAPPPPVHSEFIPQLKARALPLPRTDPPFSFVIANTLVTSNKKLTAKYHYNLRVSLRLLLFRSECLIGAS